MTTVWALVGRADGRSEAQGDGRREAGEQPVGATEHGVLLVQEQGPTEQPRGEASRNRGIAAEAGRRARLQTAADVEALQGAARQRQHALQPGGDVAGRAAGGDHVAIDVLGQVARAAAVGHHGHRLATLEEAAGQGKSREHVPARAAGGDEDRADRLADRIGHGRASSRAPRRVSASSMPIVRAMAMSEEPP